MRGFLAELIYGNKRENENYEVTCPTPCKNIMVHYIPFVFCTAMEEQVKRVTSKLVGWLKSGGKSSTTAATKRNA